MHALTWERGQWPTVKWITFGPLAMAVCLLQLPACLTITQKQHLQKLFTPPAARPRRLTPHSSLGEVNVTGRPTLLLSYRLLRRSHSSSSSSHTLTQRTSHSRRRLELLLFFLLIFLLAPIQQVGRPALCSIHLMIFFLCLLWCACHSWQCQWNFLIFVKKKNCCFPRKKRGRNKIKGTACWASPPLQSWQGYTCFLICFRCCSGCSQARNPCPICFSPQYLRLFWCLPVLAQVPKASTFFFKRNSLSFSPLIFFSTRHGFSGQIPTAPLTRLLLFRVY